MLHGRDARWVLTKIRSSFARGDESARSLTDALQTSDANGVATPANWRPGDKVIVPPPKTTDDAAQRVKSDLECKDWYFCQRSL
jgi:peroxiredoxin (alkyl hydroperoxide reductase subunit C)